MTDARTRQMEEDGRERWSGNVGLVLSGGGGKGAYEIGCWRALCESGVRIGAVSGTSVGALNAALVAQGDLDEARELWSQITAKDVFKLTFHRLPALLLRLFLFPGLIYFRHSTRGKRELDWLFFKGSLFVLLVVGVPVIAIALASGSAGWSDVRGLLFFYLVFVLVLGGPIGGWFWMEKRNLFVLDNQPLKETIVRYLDPNAVCDSEVVAIVTAAKGVEFFDPEHPTSEMVEAGGMYYHYPCTSREYLPVYSRLNGHAPDQIAGLLLGSTSLPFGIFPNRELNEAGWLDGGLADNTPVLPLVDLGCDPIVVVHLDHRVGKSRDLSRIDEMISEKVGDLERKREIEGDSAEKLDAFIARYGSRVEFTDWPDSGAEKHPEPRRPLPSLVHVVPSRRLGGLLRGTLRFSPRRARWLMKLGYEDTRKSLAGKGLVPLTRRQARAKAIGRTALLTAAITLGLLGLGFMAERISQMNSVQTSSEIPLLVGVGAAMVVGSACLFWYFLLRREASCAPAGIGMIGFMLGLLVVGNGGEGFTTELLVVDSLAAALALAIAAGFVWSALSSEPEQDGRTEAGSTRSSQADRTRTRDS